MAGENRDRGTGIGRAAAAGAIVASLAMTATALAQTAPTGAAPRPATAPTLTAPAGPAPRPAIAPQAPSAPQAGAAAQAGAAGPAPTTGPQWIKLCSADPNTKKNVCLVQLEVFADTGQLIASTTIRSVQDDPKMLFILGVPTGMMIQPGLRLQVDDGKQSELKFSICFPNQCLADMEINADFIKSVKAGKQLVIGAINHMAQPVSFPVSLAGFTKAYDGAGVDPSTPTGQAALDALSTSLKAHADEARQRLISQQQARPQ